MTTGQRPATARHRPVGYTEQQMIDALLRCAADQDSLSRNDYIRRRHDDEPSAPLLERRFGSWNAALQQAGLGTTEQPLHFQARPRSGPRK